MSPYDPLAGRAHPGPPVGPGRPAALDDTRVGMQAIRGDAVDGVVADNAAPAPSPDDTHVGLPALRDGPTPVVAARPAQVVVVAAPLGYVGDGRWGRYGDGSWRDDGFRPNDTVGLDSLTPILLVAWVLGTVAMLVTQLLQVPDDGPAAVREIARSTVWATYIAKVVTFAGLVAPMCLLAVFVAGRVMRFELPSSAYARAAAVAALPEVALFCIQRFAPDNPALRALLVLSILPAAFVVLKHAYGLRLVEAGVAYGLVLVGFAAGWLASSLVVGAVVTSGVARSQLAAAAAVEGPPSPTVAALPPSAQQPVPPSSPPSTPAPVPLPQAAPPTPTGGRSPTSAPSVAATVSDGQVADTVVAPLRIRVDVLAAQVAAAEQDGPERAAGTWQGVARDVAAAKAKYPTRPEWADLEVALAAARAKLAALPAATPPTALFEPMPAVGTFTQPSAVRTTVSLADEVSFAGFRFRPPTEARVDLEAAAAAESRNALTYALPGSAAKLTLTLVPRTNPAQRSPYVVVRPYQRAAAGTQNLYVAADLADAGAGASADVAYGRLAGEPFARVTVRVGPGGDPARDQTLYVAAADAGRWLVARIAEGNPKDPVAAVAFDAAVRTLGREQAGESTEDPYAPARVANQFAADPARVGPLFRRQPAAAEPYVVRYLGHRDAAVRRAAIELLPAVASAASTKPLLALATSEDAEVAAAVRAALRKVAPDQFDDVTEALLDLRAPDWTRRERGLDTLARAEVSVAPLPEAAPATATRSATGPAADPAATRPSAQRTRRGEASTELANLVADEQAPSAAGDKAARLLADWATPRTARRLVEMLDSPTLSPAVRDRVIVAAAGGRDRAAVGAILRWAAQAPEPVVAALTKMGPAAEEEVIRAVTLSFATPRPNGAGGPNGAGASNPYATNGPAVRLVCVRVLREVGTGRCLSALIRCGRDARDDAGRSAVKDAIDQVRVRMADNAKAGKTARPG